MSDHGKPKQGQLSRLAHWLETNESRGNRFTGTVARVFVLSWFCLAQLRRHRAEGMAAELTYRTVFSLIPVLVLGLVLFRVFGGLEDMQSKVESQLYDFFGVPDVVPSAYLEENANYPDPFITNEEANQADAPEVTLSDTNPSSAPATAASSINERPLSTQANSEQGELLESEGTKSEASPSSLPDEQTRTSIRRRMQEITRYVAAINFRSIGVLGLLLFVYAAVALANTAETIFNRIFDVISHRPIHLRLAIHWSMITLGSGLLAMSLFMSSEVIEWSGTVGVDSGEQQILRQLLSFAASWVLLFLLYALVPNIKVSLQAAATGSLVSALFWELGKYAFQIYIAKAVPYSAIYGSIGLLPLFLLWIYLTWWIVLFGLILTQTLQSFAGQSLRGLLETGRDSRSFPTDWLLPMLTEIADAFRNGESLGVTELAKRLKISTVDTARAAEALASAEMVNFVDTPERKICLARPAESIYLKDIFDLSKRITRAKHHQAWVKLDQLQKSPDQQAENLSLESLMEEPKLTNGDG